MNGVTMDNRISPTIADWFLGMIKKIIFHQNLLLYPFYAHCVEDVCAIFISSADVQSFLSVLKNQHLNFSFICEEVPGPSPTFVDVKVRIRDGECDINVPQTNFDRCTLAFQQHSAFVLKTRPYHLITASCLFIFIKQLITENGNQLHFLSI